MSARGASWAGPGNGGRGVQSTTAYRPAYIARGAAALTAGGGGGTEEAAAGGPRSLEAGERVAVGLSGQA
jgi:hypothetical protein